MYLVVAQVGIHRRIVVEDLAFAHSVICRIDSHRSPDTDSVVDAFTKEAELETEDEIAVFLLRVEIARGAVISRNIDSSIHRNIPFHVSLPLVEVGPVEQHLEALLLFLFRKFGYR